MGEAKRKRERLGEWYGKPVVPGHPDYVAPVESKPVRATFERPISPGLWRMMLLAGMSGTIARVQGTER